MLVFEAIWNEDYAYLQRFLEEGGNPNSRDESGDTLLHASIHEGSLPLLDLLLRHGASPKVIDTFGNTPMHLATLFDEQTMIELLLEHGAEVDATSETRSWTPLMIALNENHLELAHWLIHRGANPNHVDWREGWTPLLVACDMGLREFSEQLIERGARLDAKVLGGDIRGRYAIHLASYTGEVGLVRALVHRGADVNQQPDGGGLSALHWAVYNGHQDLLEYLLAQGADPNLRASGIYQMRTPLHYAVSCRQLLMAEQLLEHQASPLLRDTEGISPFDLAYNAARKKSARVYQDLVSLLQLHL